MRRQEEVSLCPVKRRGQVTPPKVSPARLKVPKRLHHFFERQCDATPGALALVCEGEHLSYDALETRAHRLAHHLLQQGLQPGDRVGILLERSVHTYVTLLAVLECGAAFVPIDPSSPHDRLAFMTQDADLRLLVTASGSTPPPLSLSCPVLDLDEEDDLIARQPTTRLTIPTNNDALCYIVYTSGSTGRPKGVAVNHSNICNFLAVCTPIYGIKPGDRVYQGMTIAFDFSIEEIWPTWNVGAALISGPTDQRRFGSALAEFLIEQAVSVLYCVPTLLATLDRDLPRLHTLIVGGEACPRELVRRWAQPGRRMLNTYGPTETTVTATWAELRPDQPVTIGRPLPNTTVHILDADLCPVPDGEVGEICIGGPGVACGYVGLPELTAESFVPDPFLPGRPNARLYRTGDRGRLTPEGEIEYLGRADTQVKLRGYRIELTGIEAVLLESDEVENALVTVTTDAAGVQDLAAYVTLRDSVVETDEMKERLQAQLRERLPAYMMPAFLEVLDTLPLLASGKADRSRLPPPVSPRLGVRGGAAPATPLEKEIAEAWADAFGRCSCPADANFFTELGGHSLFAALAVSRLRQNPALRHLAIRDLYAHPTVQGLAQYLEKVRARSVDLQKPGFSKKPGFSQAKPARHCRRTHGSLRVLTCGALQLALLYLVFGILGMPLAAVLASGAYLVGGVLAVAADLVLPLLLPLIAKWLLIGRFRPGRYPLWGWYFCRWWLVRKLQELAPLEYLAGSPLWPWYARLLGVRIGRGCHIGTAGLHVPDLVEIGDGASIGYGVEIQPYVVEDGWLVMAPIRIGEEAFVGANTVLGPGSRVESGRAWPSSRWWPGTR